MIQFRILAGQKAGTVQVIKRFPCVIGRAAKHTNWRLDEPGVWDKHLQLEFQANEGITATVLPGALASINRERFERTVLRNGDVLEFGGVKLLFWLSDTRQHGYRFREVVVWSALAAVCLFQILVIYSLLP